MRAQIDKTFADLPEEFRKEIPFSDTVMKIKTTPGAPKGTRGRIAVFEMFMMDKDIEQAILKQATEIEIQKIVRQKGMVSVRESAIIKAFEKIIPYEEVNKL
jgi:type II secretory ATPase GspE/PulE/Tfp pilus assembly ATPase PilB-like protein